MKKKSLLDYWENLLTKRLYSSNEILQGKEVKYMIILKKLYQLIKIVHKDCLFCNS